MTAKEEQNMSTNEIGPIQKARMEKFEREKREWAELERNGPMKAYIEMAERMERETRELYVGEHDDLDMKTLKIERRLKAIALGKDEQDPRVLEEAEGLIALAEERCAEHREATRAVLVKSARPAKIMTPLERQLAAAGFKKLEDTQ
jgi:hypothetical protein